MEVRKSYIGVVTISSVLDSRTSSREVRYKGYCIPPFINNAAWLKKHTSSATFIMWYCEMLTTIDIPVDDLDKLETLDWKDSQSLEQIAVKNLWHGNSVCVCVWERAIAEQNKISTSRQSGFLRSVSTHSLWKINFLL